MTDNQKITPVATKPVQPAASQPVANVEQKLDAAAEKTKQKMLNDPKVAQSFAPTPELQKEVVEIEKELLNEIILRLNQNKMSRDEAQKLAKEFLSYLPVQDQQDLLEKLKKLSKANTAAQGVYIKYAKAEEESETQKKLALMSHHLQNGNIEHAISVAKGTNPADNTALPVQINSKN
jgi:hypothetical protein